MRLRCLARAGARGVLRYARAQGCEQRRFTPLGACGCVAWRALGRAEREACGAGRAPTIVCSVALVRCGRALRARAGSGCTKRETRASCEARVLPFSSTESVREEDRFDLVAHVLFGLC